MESKAITKMPYKEKETLVAMICFMSRSALALFKVSNFNERANSRRIDNLQLTTELNTEVISFSVHADGKQVPKGAG